MGRSYCSREIVRVTFSSCMLAFFFFCYNTHIPTTSNDLLKGATAFKKESNFKQKTNRFFFSGYAVTPFASFRAVFFFYSVFFFL